MTPSCPEDFLERGDSPNQQPLLTRPPCSCILLGSIQGYAWSTQLQIHAGKDNCPGLDGPRGNAELHSESDVTEGEADEREEGEEKEKEEEEEEEEDEEEDEVALDLE